MTSQLALGVQKLLGAVCAHSIDHLTEVDTDLEQTSLLITEAIEKLASSFLAIHAAATAQQQMIDAVLSEVPPASLDRDKLDALRSAIDVHVSAAITGLQFQDITSQLIDRSRKRIQGLHDTLAVLRIAAAQISEQASADELTAQLDHTREAVSKQSSTLDGALHKAVSQTHLESGDVELF
jgi:hypothetical protein